MESYGHWRPAANCTAFQAAGAAAAYSQVHFTLQRQCARPRGTPSIGSSICPTSSGAGAAAPLALSSSSSGAAAAALALSSSSTHLVLCGQPSLVDAPQQVCCPVASYRLYHGIVLPKVALHEPRKPAGWGGLPRGGAGRAGLTTVCCTSAAAAALHMPGGVPLPPMPSPLQPVERLVVLSCKHCHVAADAHAPPYAHWSQCSSSTGLQGTPQKVPRQTSVMLSPRKSSWLLLPLCEGASGSWESAAAGHVCRHTTSVQPPLPLRLAACAPVPNLGGQKHAARLPRCMPCLPVQFQDV